MYPIIPFFPLKLVAFPGEDLNLHIFEPRYKQLIGDCLSTGSTFGICIYLDKLMPVGTEMKLLEISKKYDDGKLDIKTKAVRSFYVISFENPLQDKMYAGGQVRFTENNPVVSEVKFREYIFLLKEMLRLLHFDTEINWHDLHSFTFAHKIGLTLEQEYELLTIPSEGKRIDYLIRHFKKVLPIMKEIEKAKEKINMNGYFKYLDPLDF